MDGERKGVKEGKNEGGTEGFGSRLLQGERGVKEGMEERKWVGGWWLGLVCDGG